MNFNNRFDFDDYDFEEDNFVERKIKVPKFKESNALKKHKKTSRRKSEREILDDF